MATQSFTFPARLIEDEDGRYVVTFRDVPEALTDGATVEEALAEAKDCLDVALLSYVDDARLPRPIPVPSKRCAGEHMVAITPRSTVKLALHQALRDQRIKVKDFAGMLGVSETVARRLLDPNYRSDFDKIVEALQVVGRRVETRVLEAA
ncbi:MAG: type II toxin-antitoxin system HicB family antitoxin [Geminicoccaceae bacterium]